MKYPESTTIYNKIKDQSALTDDQLTTLGVTKDKLDTAMHQCVSKGMSRRVAMRTIYKLWNYAEPKDEQSNSNTPNEIDSTK